MWESADSEPPGDHHGWEWPLGTNARVAAHRWSAGRVKATRRAIEACDELGIRVLTLYTFSTENWRRSIAEVDFLIRLADEYAVRELPDMQRNGVSLQLMGRRDGLPATLLKE